MESTLKRMKIDSAQVSQNQSLAKASKPTSISPNATTGKPTNEASPTKKVDKTEKNQQILKRWFSRIGVEEKSGTEDFTEVIKQASRREHLLATNRMTNLQSILSNAISVNIESNDSDALDPDWFFSFAKFAEDIHSPAMQSLWGKIIAVEISKPGSFSLRTLSLLKQLTQRDAKLFSKVASVASRNKRDSTPKLLVGYYQKPGLLSWLSGNNSPHINLGQFGITYPDILSLIDMGLIFASEIETGELSTEHREEWRCGDMRFDLSPKRSGTAMIYYKFTSVGSELYRLATKQRREDYVTQLLTLYAQAFDITRH